MPPHLELTVDGLTIAWGEDPPLFEPWTGRVGFRMNGRPARIDVTGPSGCGKSTLVYALAGLKRPHAGSITWTLHHGHGAGSTTNGPAGASPSRVRYTFSADQMEAEWSLESRRFRREVAAYCFQTPTLLRYWRLAESVAFARTLADERHRPPGPWSDHGADADWVERLYRDDERAAADGKRPIGTMRPSTMSGGQRQRAALAIALTTRPHILILDEPSGNLDPHTRRDLLATIRGWQAETGGAALAVTHQQAVDDGSRDAEMEITFRLVPRGPDDLVEHGQRRTYSIECRDAQPPSRETVRGPVHET